MNTKLEYIKHLVDNKHHTYEKMSDGVISIRIFSNYENTSDFFKKMAILIDTSEIEEKLDNYISKDEYKIITENGDINKLHQRHIRR